MFLVIGYHNEVAIKHFIAFLSSKKEHNSFDFLNLTDVENTADIEISFGNDLWIRVGDKVFDFSHYNFIYSRCLYQAPSDKNNVLKVVNFNFLIQNYLESCDKVVLNRPSAGNSNYTKLYHIKKLNGFGFKTPHTYIFGAATAAKKIVAANGDWISKGTSSIRTKAVELDEVLYADLYLLNRIPSLFQEHIKGFDVRLHLIGEKPLALKIESPNVDYRYNTTGNVYSEISMPTAILNKCIDFCAEEGLLFAGIDFKVTEEGEWVILEVNNTPGYNFFDNKMNYAISNALFDFLNQSQMDYERYWKQPISDKTFITPERRTMS